MHTYELYLGSPNGKIEIEITKKDIKNINLKVYRNLKVKVSAPKKVSQKRIITFINEKANWIDKQISKYKVLNKVKDIKSIETGSIIQYLGKRKTIQIKKSSQNKIEIKDEKINIYLKNTDNKDAINKIFSKWWKDQATYIFNIETDKLYNKIYKKYKVNRPTVFIRKMKTLWGSCMKSKNKITLNEHLLKYDIKCIQYVILHELTHLLYSYHNKDFYNFLTRQMPDWKQRKKQLDNSFIQ